MQSGTHFAILHFFAPAKTCKICLLGASPNSPARAAYAALPNAPQVERLRALAGAEYGRLDRLGVYLMVWSARQDAQPPRQGWWKGRRWRPFSGVWVPVPNKRFAGVYILLPCLPRLFSVGSGFPPRMETVPERDWTPSHTGAVMRNDRTPFPGGLVMIQAPSVPRPQRPVLSGFGRLDLSTSAPSAGPRLQTLSGLLRFRGGCGILKLSASHTRACCFLFCGAQLYKTMLSQLMPSYSMDLRKRPFHAGLCLCLWNDLPPYGG